MRKIYFDEAGNSGNNLLDKEQPLFCYLGFEDCDSNTIEDFYSLKRKYKYKTDLEVKGASLSKSVTGQKFLIELCITNLETMPNLLCIIKNLH